MIIVSLHVLGMEDALLKVEALYDNPWQSAQIGIAGVFFLFMGLIFAKILIQLTRPADDVVLYGKWGHANVSLRAIEDLARKVIRKFDVVRHVDLKTEIVGGRLKIEVNLSVFIGWNLPELVNTVQADLSERLRKVLGNSIELDLIVNIVHIIDQPVIAESASGIEK